MAHLREFVRMNIFSSIFYRFIISYPWHHSAIEAWQLGTVVGNLFLHHPEKQREKSEVQEV